MLKTKIRFEKNCNTIINTWKPCYKIGKIMGNTVLRIFA